MKEKQPLNLNALVKLTHMNYTEKMRLKWSIKGNFNRE